MFERLQYKNHLNEVYDFGTDGIYVNSNDLHDYEWAVTTRGDRISAFNYAVSKRKLPIVILCLTEEEGIAARNRLMEVTEKDVLAMKHGRIITGDYYFRCFVMASEKAKYSQTKRRMLVTLTLVSDYPYWVKETPFVFRKLGAGGGGSNLDYPHDYAFDFFAGSGNKQFNNTGFVGTNFRMTIFGPCIDPAVYVAGHKYQVNTELAASEYLTIDSVNKTIYKTGIDGSTVNLFSRRDRDSYIFERIPPGMNNVVWDGGFGVDITLLEERSEPKWT